MGAVAKRTSVLLLLFNSTRALAGIAAGQGTADAKLAVLRSEAGKVPGRCEVSGGIVRIRNMEAMAASGGGIFGALRAHRMLHAVAAGSAVPTAELVQVYRLAGTAAGGAQVAGILKAARPQVNTPGVRLAIVGRETRAMNVAAEVRIIPVAPDHRVLAIAADQRTVAVPAEYRSIAA